MFGAEFVQNEGKSEFEVIRERERESRVFIKMFSFTKTKATTTMTTNIYRELNVKTRQL